MGKEQDEMLEKLIKPLAVLGLGTIIIGLSTLSKPKLKKVQELLDDDDVKGLKDFQKQEMEGKEKESDGDDKERKEYERLKKKYEEDKDPKFYHEGN